MLAFLRFGSLVVLAGLPLFSQAFSIDAGSAAESVCSGSKYGATQQADMASQAPPFNTLRYGSTVTCNIPVPIGTCTPTLQFFENRPVVATATIPASGIGTRVFTVSVNGSAPITVDIFAAVGAQTPYMLALAPVTVADGFLHVSLTASKGNASISGALGSCLPPTPPTVLPFTQDQDGTWRFTGNLRLTGQIEMPVPIGFTFWVSAGTSPAAGPQLTIRQPDGTACTVVPSGNILTLNC